MLRKLCDKIDAAIARRVRHENSGAGVFYQGESAVGMLAVKTAAKRVWKSKTVWLNGLAILFSSLLMMSPEIRDAFGDVTGPQIVLVLGVLNALIRVFTVSPLTFSNEGVDNYERNRYGPDYSDSGSGFPRIGPVYRQSIDRTPVPFEGDEGQDGADGDSQGSSSDKNPAGF
jgi:hypothetical protein